MTDILVIAAHPDDEVLGCGGTLAKWTSAGKTAEVLILGEGSTSRQGGAGLDGVEALRCHAETAASLLGVRKVHFAGLPDNRFDTIPLLDVVQTIEDFLQQVRPDTVLVQHGGDLNVDHQVTFRAAMTALRPLPGVGVRKLLAYEVASSSEWAFQRFSPVFRPNVFVDISDVLEKKIAAMQAYESESRAFPHPRSPESLRAQAAVRGSMAGLAAAEAFETIWEKA